MKPTLLFFILVMSGHLPAQDWMTIKDTSFPHLHLLDEFETPYQQPTSTLGWEDGVHISPNGLYLYCTYVPIDVLSFSLNSDLPNDFTADYSRGAPLYGMDMVTNPIGAPEWLHSDILVATRTSTEVPFTTWELSNMARNFYSEGAPMPLFENDTLVEMMTFTSNDNFSNNSDIWLIENTGYNPSGIGDSINAPLNSHYKEDNPNLTRISDTELILFFDSDDIPGGEGDIDIWFAYSNDNGLNWSIPENVADINTATQEHQPFIYYNAGEDAWYLYYSAKHTDGKLAIFRSKQALVGNWNAWEVPELVISAGTTAGIGEPTLTRYGDLSFVVVYHDSEENSIYNRFDADAWYLPRKTFTALEQSAPTEFSFYPNPIIDRVHFNEMMEEIKVFSTNGMLLLQAFNQTNLNLRFLSSGIYYGQLKKGDHIETVKLIKR